MSDIRQLEDVNFLGRNFSKLPLLYETINKFHHSLYCFSLLLLFFSGLLGETWVVLGVFLP